MLENYNKEMVAKTYKFILLFLLFTSSCFENPIESLNDEEEYLIYKEVLQNKFGNFTGTIVLDDSTKSEQFGTSNIKYLCEEIGIKEETMMDYIEVNAHKIKIKKFDDINFIFRSEYKYSQSNFYNVYISKVGFDSTLTQAVVTIGIMYSTTDAGEGNLFVLEKKENFKWQITKTFLIWVA